MMALIIAPDESLTNGINHCTSPNCLDVESCPKPYCKPQNTYIGGQSPTSVVIRTQEGLDRESMEQSHVIRRRPTCRFMNTAFFKDLKAIGGAEDQEVEQMDVEEENEGENKEDNDEDEQEYHRLLQLNPLGNDLPPGHNPPLGFGHPSWEPIGDLAVQEAEEIISSLEMIPELPEPQDDLSERLLYIERTISALSGETKRSDPSGSQTRSEGSQSPFDEWLTASDASSQTSWVTHVTSEHRPLWGETKPIGTKLIVSRLNEEEPNDPEDLNLYYLPDLKEWRPFPVEVEVWNAPEPVDVLKKKSRVKRIASAVVTRIKCGAYGYRAHAPLDKRLISMPVEGSKRGMIEALLEDK
ncbi:hypothetical protein DFP73DRAFT_584516 [Morchella snyderi]|nr:hypothetical protein DFP73DRAFT_584516 [Morchella snyderi]